MKIWDKGGDTNKFVEQYTVGNDRMLDMYLAESDVLGTIAHTKMLCKIGIIARQELEQLHGELVSTYNDILRGDFEIAQGIEDVHSQVEYLLTQKLGEVGKKVHSGRSRNDQVLVDIRLFTRDRLIDIALQVGQLFQTLIQLSEKHKDVLLPGYTHLQVAMPSSFGLWFGAYAEALADDLQLMHSAYLINNQNPLGSAAGYGSSFPLDRTLTTSLLGFNDLDYNVVYAQMGRGKVERIVAFAMANLAFTLGKLASDVCLFMSQNFGFVSLPDSMTTGSSIMPHKKNPDLFEITRAKCNRVQAIPTELAAILGNLPSGYFRDYQLIKQPYLPLFDEMSNILGAVKLGVENLRVNSNILTDSRYSHIFTVEKVNDLVVKGIPFRDAYRMVGREVEEGTFTYGNPVSHTHEGSIGNLCNQDITRKFLGTIKHFDPDSIRMVKEKLLASPAW